MKNLCVFLVGLLLISNSWPQKLLKEPLIRVCTFPGSCVNGTKDLPDMELAQLREIRQAAPPGATEKDITKFYRLKPGSLTPPMEIGSLPKGTKIRRGIWYVTSKTTSEADPHIDVLFANDKAIDIRWWPLGCCSRKIEIMYLAE